MREERGRERDRERDPGMHTHQLIGHVGVVPTSHALPDGRLHETRQGRQHIDGRIDLQGQVGTNTRENASGWSKPQKRDGITFFLLNM